MDPGSSPNVVFIGAGKMAEAMISPLQSIPNPPSVGFYEVSPSITKATLAKYPRCIVYDSLVDAAGAADLLILAVKPQNSAKVFEGLRPVLSDHGAGTTNPVVLSIMAGVPIERMVEGLGTPKVIRSMPNTPAMIEQGVTVWCKNGKMPTVPLTTADSYTPEEVALTKVCIRAMGTEILVDDEQFIDMATSISGSGPAYVFMLIEAMVDSGVHMGFPRDVATKLVHQTLLGSTIYAMGTEEHPAVLKNSVTSPAGTTASAMYELEKGRFRTVVQDAIWACYRRSLEMGGQDSNVGPGRRVAPAGEFPDFVTVREKK